MSKLIVEEKNGKISGVHFAWVKLQKPVKKYQSEDTEYVVDVVVDKATAKEVKKMFPKNGVREVETASFEEDFKFAPPFPEQEEQYILKFKSASHYNDGTEKPYNYTSRPKVYVPVDGQVKDVTMSVRVGNGSSGDLAFSIMKNDFGTMHNLTGILVKDMIELQERNSTPFGDLAEQEENVEEHEDTQVPF